MSKYKLLTFAFIYLLILCLLTTLFASSVVFHIINIIVTIVVFIFLNKSSKIISLIFLTITILAVITVTTSNFEESYCWNKGEQLDKSGSEMIVTTKEDEKLLKAYLSQVREGDKVGASFRGHMLCHKTYNFNEAIKDILKI